MRSKYWLGLLLLLVGTAQAASFPGQPTISCAGARTLVDDGTWIILAATPSAGQFGTPRQGVVQSGYTPSGTKTFQVYCMVVGGGSCGLVQAGYSDSDRGNTNASNGANPFMTLNVFNGASQTAPQGVPLNFTVPNGKFPSVSPGAQCSITLIGKEI